MKKYLSLIVFVILVIMFISIGQCSAQVKIKPDTMIILSVYEKSKVEQNQEWIKQFQKQQDEFGKFLMEFIRVNGIDPRRVSGHPDSLKFENGKIIFHLRKKS